ncbi:aminopeptidase P family protein [Parasulfitobacter algicola]|uniref:Aminopeptidase P family protein n=1 Tax=Parasulfitobacter algicola TaxID=2614809 RepID=A0ABX2IMR2_9RHOB|nr:aminopeptidase P family protein [Sulfitobacter algicola]NSX54169.1 aminopeptidase P family protein [Sulfitobacter algicola]
MFQTFDPTTTPEQGPPRLAKLRGAMADQGLDGYIIPRADVHQGENVAPRDERLAWLTGFTGSAGFCIALNDIAGVFIDGRYRLQVRDQVADVFTPVNWPETKPGDWLKDQLTSGIIGFDSWLHTQHEIEQIEKALAGTDITLRPDPANLIDHIWDDQPPAPDGKTIIYPADLAGKTHDEKRSEVAQTLKDAGQNCAILTLPDSIAWLLNIRGSDIDRMPVVQAFAILRADETVDLFSNNSSLGDLTDHLGGDVRLHPITDFTDHLNQLTGTIRVDPKSAPLEVTRQVTKAQIAYDEDPCILPKACKTDAEITATREAHLRDGAAVVEFLAWLDRQDPETLTEIDVVKTLEGYRRATNALRDISFETISGTGPNGAIVHYRVTTQTNRQIRDGDLLLVDSGGQYIDGTTDITRTIAMGDPDEEPRRCFTRVLQGMITLSRVRFPKGLAGRDLDALARFPLWTAGLDFDHGTGHGVGVYLGVHEGPQRISRASEVPLKPGMILSNEPGYYRDGAFGIRIENLIVVQPAPELPGADDRQMLSFETLTYVPIDRNLIVTDMLDVNQRQWINDYHTDCLAKLGDRLSTDAKAWLTEATRPL